MSYLQTFKHKNFAFFWVAQLISQIGDRFHQIALLWLIGTKPNSSTMDLAHLMAFTIIPVFIIGPVAGVLVDRWDRKLILFISDIGRGLLVLLIPLILLTDTNQLRWGMTPVYVVVFFVFCLSRFHVPAKMSLVPKLIPEKLLSPSNSLVSVSGMIAFVIGILSGGMYVEHFGARSGFLVDVGTYFLSALLIVFISRKQYHVHQKDLQEAAQEITQREKNMFQEVKEGLSYIKSKPEIARVLKLMGIIFMAAGSIYVVIVTFIQQSFGTVVKELAILTIPFGIGAFLGAFVYGKISQSVSRLKIIFICLLIGGITVGLFTLGVHFTKSLIITMGLAVALGGVLSPIAIAANTLIHQVCHDEMQGKVFSALEFVMHLGFIVAMYMSAALADTFGQFWILLSVGLVLSFIGMIGLFNQRKFS